MIPASKVMMEKNSGFPRARELAVGASHDGTCGLSLRSREEESKTP